MSLLGEKIFNDGKLEAQKKIAKNLMDILNDKVISEKCDLPLEEIRKLRKEYKNN